MAFSLLRSFMAATRLNITQIKRQAKRLHKAAPEVFGAQYPLAACQEAMARAHGYQHWHEAQRVLSRVGADRSAPFWTIESRNDRHQDLLQALVDLEIEILRDGAVVFLGSSVECAAPALCLFLEEMSAARRPGLILLETDQPAMQDTALWPGIVALDREDLMTGFRSLDLRETRVPMAIGAPADAWKRALAAGLPLEEYEKWLSTGEAVVFERLIEAFAIKQGGGYRDDFYPVEQAFSVIRNPSGYSKNTFSWLDVEERTGLGIDMECCLENSPSPQSTRLLEIVAALEGRHHWTGRVMTHETKHRPTVALFSRDDPASLVLASIVHFMYHWRYFSDRLKNDTEPCPVLYFADKPVTEPSTLFYGSSARTVIVPGTDGRNWPWRRLKSSRFVTVSGGEMTAAGQRRPLHS
jgi:hypothetical protein